MNFMEPTKPATGPRDVFLQLMSIFALYMSAISLGIIFFQYINLYIPDPLVSDAYRISSYLNFVRWSIASLIIVFPVYLWITWYLKRDLKKFPEKRGIRTRKWLFYFTLFAAAIIIIIDLIFLIFNYLQGDLTGRFALKILAIFFITASIFGYYLWVLRREREGNFGASGKMKIFVWIIIAVVAASVIFGFFVAGSPQSERLKKFDQQRLSDLQNLQGQIIFFWQQKNRLPANQDELIDTISGYIPPKDPQTRSAYDYRVLGNLDFELCATFATEGDSESNFAPKPLSMPSGGNLDNWRHGTGRTCFERLIDPDLYKIPKAL